MGPPPAANSSTSSNSTNSSTNLIANDSPTKTTPTTTNSTTSGGSSNNEGTTNNSGPSRSLKKSAADSDLKGSVIEFMRSRPFLWNKRHAGYKDHKKRDHEFQEYSKKIGYSVQEIKRVWHVLRTNFFRAHKTSQQVGANNVSKFADNNQHNGTEKLWKYYTAMLYILEGSNLAGIPAARASSSALVALGDRSSSSSSSGTGSQLVVVEPRPVSGGNKNHNHTYNTGRRVSNRVAANNMAANHIHHQYQKGDTNGSDGVGRAVHLNHNHRMSITSTDTSMANTPTSKLSTTTFANESLLDEDDDFLYARSLSLTLRKFDPTTKEIVKLKFQEIIVEYMQQLQRQHQQQQLQSQLNHHQSQQQLSQLQPAAPPSEMEASSNDCKKQAATYEVT